MGCRKLSNGNILLSSGNRLEQTKVIIDLPAGAACSAPRGARRAGRGKTSAKVSTPTFSPSPRDCASRGARCWRGARVNLTFSPPCDMNDARVTALFFRFFGADLLSRRCSGLAPATSRRRRVTLLVGTRAGAGDPESPPAVPRFVGVP